MLLTVAAISLLLRYQFSSHYWHFGAKRNIRAIFVLFALLVLLFGFSLLVHWQGFAFSQAMEWLLWLIFVDAFRSIQTNANTEARLLRNFFLVGAVCVSLLGGIGYLASTYSIQPLWLATFAFPETSLGYPNFAAHFFAVLLLLIWWVPPQGRAERCLRPIGIFCSLLALIFLQSRAAIFACIFALLLPQLWQSIIVSDVRKRNLFKLFIALCVGVALIGGYWLSLSPGDRALKEKNQSLRLNRWANTLQLLKVNYGAGVGPGLFEFAYPHFGDRRGYDSEIDEYETIRSPHNAFLEIAAELGVPALVVVVALLIALARSLAQQTPSSTTNFVYGLFIFLVFDGFVAFPLEVPFTFLCSTYVCGYILRGEYSQTLALQKPNKVLSRLLPTATILVLMSLGYLRWQSMWHESFVSDSRALTESCLSYPDQWTTCIKAIRMLRQNQDFAGAEQLVSNVKNIFPKGLAFERERIFIQIESGKWVDACKSGSTYCESFGGPKCQFSEYIERFCAVGP